jgi:hypothetical protein
MTLTEQQRIMLTMALRLGGGELWMPREDGGTSSRYYGEILDLEHRGYLSAPSVDPRIGALRWKVTEAGKQVARDRAA